MNYSDATMKRKILARIEKEMDAKGISQAEVGRRTDISRNHINAYFRARNLSLSFDRIFQIAEAVGLEIDIVVRKKRKRA